MAVLAGADGWTAIETYGQAKLKWLRQFLALPNGIPSHDTIARVFSRLDPQVFEQCFINWIESITQAMGVQVIPIDGKQLRQSFDRNGGQQAIQVVSAWASQHRLVLGQVKKTTSSGYGRIEIRQYWSVPVSALGELTNQEQWSGLKSVGMVVCERRLWNKTTVEVRFYP